VRHLAGGLAAVILALSSSPAIGQELRPPGAGGRPELEQRFRQRMAQVVKNRVGLTDEQMRQLGPVSRKYEDERRKLHQEERLARMTLRRNLLTPDSADQPETARLIDQLMAIQRRRLDLLAAEQRELAAFMSPVQRAKYLVLQDQLRRQLEERVRRQERRARIAEPVRRP
jgi:protein CpxP